MKKTYICTIIVLFVLLLTGCNGLDNTYTVTLNANGGTPELQMITVKYGKPMPTAKKPVRPGYEFLG